MYATRKSSNQPDATALPFARRHQSTCSRSFVSLAKPQSVFRKNTSVYRKTQSLTVSLPADGLSTENLCLHFITKGPSLLRVYTFFNYFRALPVSVMSPGVFSSVRTSQPVVQVCSPEPYTFLSARIFPSTHRVSGTHIKKTQKIKNLRRKRLYIFKGQFLLTPPTAYRQSKSRLFFRKYLISSLFIAKNYSAPRVHSFAIHGSYPVNSCHSWFDLSRSFRFYPPLYAKDGSTFCRARRSNGRDGERPRRDICDRQGLLRASERRARLRSRLHLLQRPGSRTNQNRKCSTGNFPRELGGVSIAQATFPRPDLPGDRWSLPWRIHRTRRRGSDVIRRWPESRSPPWSLYAGSLRSDQRNHGRHHRPG